jgi:hypothetical protein
MQVALEFTAAHGWRTVPAPPAWWLDEQDELLEQDGRPRRQGS